MPYHTNTANITISLEARTHMWKVINHIFISILCLERLTFIEFENEKKKMCNKLKDYLFDGQ